MTTLAEQFTFEKLIVPIIVALLTTLVVEYFAKPRLEARKARIIRDRQQFDKVIYCFQRVAASLGALPEAETANRDKVTRRFTMIMLDEAKSALYELLKEMTQLSHIYIHSHHEHVSKTSLFIGYLLARVELTIEDTEAIRITELKELASHLELFDVYYLVYVYLYDSQESSVRRILWRIRRKRRNNEKINALFSELDISSN